MKYLLDTNVLKELGKTKPHKNVAAWLKGVDDADLAISALSVREIEKGVAALKKTKPKVGAELEVTVRGIFDAFEGRILPVDRAVAAAWGVFLAESDKHTTDTGLAATALVHGLTVVTRNTADFIKRGVKVIDPFKAVGKTASSPSAVR